MGRQYLPKLHILKSLWPRNISGTCDTLHIFYGSSNFNCKLFNELGLWWSCPTVLSSRGKCIKLGLLTKVLERWSLTISSCGLGLELEAKKSGRLSSGFNWCHVWSTLAPALRWRDQRGYSATLEEGCCSDTWYDLYRKLQLQFYVFLMMGAMDIRNM